MLGTNIVDTGSGYNSQNAMPVHFGLAEEGLVDVEVTTLTFPTGLPRHRSEALGVKLPRAPDSTVH